MNVSVFYYENIYFVFKLFIIGKLRFCRNERNKIEIVFLSKKFVKKGSGKF